MGKEKYIHFTRVRRTRVDRGMTEQCHIFFSFFFFFFFFSRHCRIARQTRQTGTRKGKEREREREKGKKRTQKHGTWEGGVAAKSSSRTREGRVRGCFPALNPSGKVPRRRTAAVIRAKRDRFVRISPEKHRERKSEKHRERERERDSTPSRDFFEAMQTREWMLRSNTSRRSCKHDSTVLRRLLSAREIDR